ncbi:seryl-tRNA synthetase [Nitratiruptor sp. YY08-26]|nr:MULTISPECIES: serine--tRNA ligase [unclassified Nitratiruptor]BCD62698.1 seryl-tRNA synthetase [Nitratiruptor sp. YY08-13]BCD66634.1 seryl-tRNA synthetase [Nitratiruptor sp. YY08-26]
MLIDLKALEKDFDTIAQRLQTKGVEEKLLAELKELFEEYKREKTALQELQAKQNSLSKMFGVYKREGKDINELKNELEINKGKIAAHQEVVRDLEEKLSSLALTIPNPPDPDVPVGEDEEDNVVIKTILEPKEFDFTPKEHWELGENLGWIDFERGVKLAKSRFSVLKKDAARLERALINFMLDHNKEYGFEEVCVPFMANSTTLLGTGQLPKFEEDLFKVCDEDLYLIPTAEVPLTNLYRDEIIKDLESPIKLTAYTPCFRKEAGSGGRDVRGMIRQHQFDKVELVAITKPEESDNVFEEMVECASSLLAKLGLPHRHVMLCTGDLGFSAAKTIDLEVWLPGQGKYREISSISNTRDFQARRAQIRYKDGKKNLLVHTLNGSSLAVGRTLIAIMENYQTKEGTIEIPEVLHPYI